MDAGRIIAAATAVALGRGGLPLSGDLLACLDSALRRQPIGERATMSVIRLASGAVVQARLDGDPLAYDAARLRLQGALADYWAGRALAGEVGA